MCWWQGGAAAEDIAGFAKSRYSRDDYKNARTYARSVVYSTTAVQALITYAMVEAKGLLLQYWPCVAAVADELLLLGTITGAQIDITIADELAKAARRGEAARRAQWDTVVESAARPERA